jgi:hypothetical protein
MNKIKEEKQKKKNMTSNMKQIEKMQLKKRAGKNA